MENTTHSKYRKQAYLYHLILAVAICVVLAMHIHLVLIDASSDVIGGGIFLLVMWFGLPVLFLILAVIYYSLKSIQDKKLLLLTEILFFIMFQWFIEVEPAMLISIALESLYVVLALTIGIRSFLDIKNEASN